jgi:hypothetical protein
MKKTSKFFLLLVICVLIVLLLPIIFGSIYETYDDLGMRAAIEGKLFYSIPNSNFVFIKQILARFILVLPSQNFLPYSNYDLVQFLLIGVSMGVIIHMLAEEKLSRIVFISTTCGIFALVTTLVIQPQFTNTAGLLGIAGILSLRKYVTTKSRKFFFTFLLFFMFSFWMRSEIALVIFLIGLTGLFDLLYDNKLRPLVAILTVVLLSVVLTLFVEDYSIAENSENHEINVKRESVSKFFDYNLGKKLLKPSNADLIKNSVFSSNDIKLFHNKFYDWPEFDTLVPHLNKISTEYYSERDYISSRVSSSLYSFKYIFKSGLNFLMIPIVILLLTYLLMVNEQKKRIFAVGLILVLAAYILYLGFYQRYSLSRLYITPFLLVIVLFIINLRHFSSTNWVSVIVMSSMLIYTFGIYINHNKRLEGSIINQQYFNEIVTNNNLNGIVLFNSAFDVSQLFPVYPRNIKDINFKGVGIVREAESVVRRLLNNEQIIFASNKESISLLDTFCKEHYDRSIEFELMDKKLQLYTVKLK